MILVVSYGFYHFSCILLLSYKPGPKFAIRNTESLSATDVSISLSLCVLTPLTPLAADLRTCTRYMWSV